MLDTENAEEILTYLRKYEYASKRHALLELLWHTGMRMGAAHSLDVDDFKPDERALAVKHRPGNGTTLKNKESGERMCALSQDVCDVLSDYLDVHRDDVLDDNERQPLFTTSQGRMHRSKIRQMVYAITRPCAHGQECPRGRNPDDCKGAKYDHASKCPVNVSPHDIRRGSITEMLRDEVPKQVVSDRVNSSVDTLDKHYNKMIEDEKMEQRREFFD